ncbi:MAG TPA: FAD-dependent oxidoreductase [Solirubrobacteraceae bacterium]
MKRRRVVVIGGGLAGITAALDCAEAGERVTLLEVRPRLGGAAYSFERDGLRLDNGQHVFLRCCAAYGRLLERLGSSGRVHIQARLEIPVLCPHGRRATLRRGTLPAPLHLVGALARYPHLGLGEKVKAARAALALARFDRAEALERERVAGTTLGMWLAEHGQGERAVAALWDLIALPTLNVPAARGSLALGAFVLRTGLLEHNDAGDIGFHTRPLSETLGDPAERVLRARGVDVRLGMRAEAVEVVGSRRDDSRARSHARACESGGGAGVLRLQHRGPCAGVAVRGGDPGAQRPTLRVHAGGGAVAADAVVCAVPHQRAASLLEPLLGVETERWRALGESPIVNVHVVYDRRVCGVEFAAGVGTPVQYVFDRTRAVGISEGQCLAVSLSGAEREMGMEPVALRERYLEALRELFPRAREAVVRSVHVSREHAATFRAVPGSEALRPGTRTTVPGLVLAGAWTDTGWPATLEGAVLSGHSAARAAMAV